LGGVKGWRIGQTAWYEVVGGKGGDPARGVRRDGYG